MQHLKMFTYLVTLVTLFTSANSDCTETRRQQKSNGSEEISTFLYNPCGETLNDKPLKRFTMKNLSQFWSFRPNPDPLRFLKIQLNIVISHFSIFKESEMRTVYTTSEQDKELIEYHCVPSNQWTKYLSFKMDHRKINLVKYFLPIFYSRLVQYWEIFEKLSSVAPRMVNDIILNLNRQSIIYKLKSYLKTLICEAETSLTYIPRPKKPFLLHIEGSLDKIQEFLKCDNFKYILSYDSWIFEEYEKFLSDWQMIVKDLEMRRQMVKKNMMELKTNQRVKKRP